jgi:16S rRNA (guanine1207-N2)-methyltransferase
VPADADPAGGRSPSGEHYFSAEPASAEERRTLTVHLAGRDLPVRTAAGVFSPGRLDLGTQVLLRSVPGPPPTGDVLDLGCGWGPIALTMALLSPGCRVWAVDVNTRALDLVRGTAADLAIETITAVTPGQVPPDVRFAAIWSNPPIRIGKPALHDLLGRWLPRLTDDGAAHLVVQRNLGADSLQRWLDDELGLPVDRVASAKGFRVLRVSAGEAPGR